MGRPLTPLSLGNPRDSWDTRRFNLTKGTKVSPVVLQSNFPADYLTFSEGEVRQLHSWLGKVVEDLDQGV